MTVTLRPVREEELPRWLEASHRFYVHDLIEHAGMTRQEAEEKAERDQSTSLPGGRPREGDHLFMIEDESGTMIGRLWFSGKPFGAWLYQIDIDEQFRGRGLGREAMLAFEQVARELGFENVALNVFGGNDVARSLYRSLGYGEVSVHMSKRL